ncbi:hypothetical protein [Bifidobacterium oedipodis]|uniref:Alginate lyase domain-containing protein n=1 Tax=Bifidobacterium oedipodis TaxID=2675322 RepID=A0A7Y0EMZ8_9BIFI|nr:hypothetical protein [Bifidobacterium sp. DSM 109957]NMM92863.1 hypothetical protein [Bifidobacterium sp. DSM 109957]
MMNTVNLLQQWIVDYEDGKASMCFPSSATGNLFQPKGFLSVSDKAFDASTYAGLRLTFTTATANTTITVAVSTLDEHSGQVRTAHASFTIASSSQHAINLAWGDFDVPTSNRAYWRFVTQVSVHWNGAAQLTDAELCPAFGLAATCDVRGRSIQIGDTAEYDITVSNCLGKAACVRACQTYYGWESMNAQIKPQTFCLQPGERTVVHVTVPMHDRIVPGGRERTTIRFVADGDSDTAVQIELFTMRTMPHPYIVHTAEGWSDVASRIAAYPKFHAEVADWHQLADDWTPKPTAEGEAYCYPTQVENNLMACAYLYAVTADNSYADKIAQFLLFFADEKRGYPARLRGCHQSFVQEGHFFQHLAIAYDVVLSAGILDDSQQSRINHCLRLYIGMVDDCIASGGISNWVVSELTSALFAALVLQDWSMVDRFVYGTCGTIEQFRYGTLNDGWWHECSIGYNTWVSSEFLMTAQALLPFGEDLAHRKFALPHNMSVSASYACEADSVGTPATWVCLKWGGNVHETIGFKALFDAPLKFIDWRGVMFGVNDSDEKKIDTTHWNPTYDLAYRFYGDPEYIPVMERFDNPDPVFGIPELPSYAEALHARAIIDGRTPESSPARLSGRNAYSDNIGLAMLRSQTPGREQREQIQATLHYGSHGGAHGHFDITDLLSIMRYGRSLFNPEANWWGYDKFMYKWHVQASLTKNMVNVDDKMQLPADSRRTLFYSGKALQAAAIDTACEWAYAPYLGMDYGDCGGIQERLAKNHMSFPVQSSLAYAQISGTTEPIRQQRVMAVTDDYIVVFDAVSGDMPHQYETTWQLKGLRGITPLREGKLIDTGHTAQYTDNPASDGQVITDCQWYQAEGTTRASFENTFDPNWLASEKTCIRSSYNEPGVLHTDVYTAWPLHNVQVTGQTASYYGWAADNSGYNIPLRWQVDVDGETQAHGAFDGWILGRDNIHIDLTGASSITLRCTQGDVTAENGAPVRTPDSIFWGKAELVTADGQHLALADIAHTATNIAPGYGPGKDYKGGRVTIQGEEFPNAIPASPIDHDKEGILTWQIDGLNAVSLEACIGVDAIPGDESQNRMFYAVRATKPTPSARFITVIEPYEATRCIRNVQASSAQEVTVTLAGGRSQTISLVDDEEKPAVCLIERSADGTVLRKETSLNQ